MMLSKDKKILIVGLGLIGGSYAEGLTNAGYQVYALTKDQSSIDYAKNKKIIIDGKKDIEVDYISSFDIVVFCLYPKVFIEWIKCHQYCLKKGAIITDVTGVKGSIVYEIQSILREDVEFIPAHPMAGKEVYGVENSDASIFKNANYIVTPTKNNTPFAIAVAKEIGKVLNFKNIVELSPEEHDEMIGFLSQLTHCIAVVLMTCKDSQHLVEYTGDSFRDLTRIAKINETMWSELFLLNKEELLKQMDLFISQFKMLRDYLSCEDSDKMKEMMILSTKRRKYFDK